MDDDRRSSSSISNSSSNKRPSSSSAMTTTIATSSSSRRNANNNNSRGRSSTTTSRRPYSSPSLVSSASGVGGGAAEAEAASTNIALLEKQVVRRQLLQPHHRPIATTTTKKPGTATAAMMNSTTMRPHSTSSFLGTHASASTRKPHSSFVNESAAQANNAKATTSTAAKVAAGGISRTTKRNANDELDKKTKIDAKDSSSSSTDDEDPSSPSASSNDKITPTTSSDNESEEQEKDPEQQLLIDALGKGSYHLPGNNWCQDWLAYFGNNHPLFSLCFSNRLNPISKWMRLVGFLGSIIFGLAITNLVWLLFVYGNDENANEVYFSMSSLGFQIKNGTQYTYMQEDNNGVAKLILETATGFEVSTGMIILWTLGGAIHAIYDNLIWYASTCSCFGEFGKKYKRLGSILVMVSVVLVAIASTITIIIRINLDNQETKQEMILKSGMDLKAIQIDLSQITDKSNYEFLMAYAIELVVAWFVHYPIQETILFSGCLGCWWWCGYRQGFTGVTPNSLPAPLASFLGGRPYEIYKENKMIMAQDINADDDVGIIVIDDKSTRSRTNSSSGQNNNSNNEHRHQNSTGEDVERGSSF